MNCPVKASPQAASTVGEASGIGGRGSQIGKVIALRELPSGCPRQVVLVNRIRCWRWVLGSTAPGMTRFLMQAQSR
jgi:hypothetical protein